MKLKLCALLCAIMMAGGALSACNETTPIDTPTESPESTETTDTSGASDEPFTLLGQGIGEDYLIVYGVDDRQGAASTVAAALKRELHYVHGLPSYKSRPSPLKGTDREILIGNTGRELSNDLIAAIMEKAGSSDALVWGYAYRDGKFAYAANSPEALDRGLAEFAPRYVRDGAVVISESLWEITVLSREEYNAELKAEEDRLAAEEAAEKQARLDAIKAKLNAFDYTKFGKATADISKLTSKKYSTPTQTVKAEHPRVGLTADMLPAIRAAMENLEYKGAVSTFRSYVDQEYTGILSAPVKDFQGRKGLHNHDKPGLAVIEAKALNYLLTGDEFYGYEAILAMLNYIDTLDIQYINSDGCRDYGYTMFVAAEVYDWCYPLLTEQMKSALIAGVETRLCAGQVGDPSFTSTAAYKLKMEVGFPPTGQSGVNGHGAEMQLLRDYLAFSIAIYNENSSWWNFCAGRLQDEYIPFRVDYYKTGTYPQGSSYVNTRFFSDLSSAWLYMKATGENPYTGIGAIVPYIFSTILPDGQSVYGAGDSTLIPKITSYRNIAIMTGAVTGDPTAWACAKYASTDFAATGTGYTAITASAYLIYVSGGTESVKDIWANLNVIQYNGYHLGQLVSRSRWEDPNAASTWMKMGVKTTANHEHGDAGTFQIYYKGMLSSDGGQYSNYGHYQTRYYHQSTISHNGLLIADPAQADPKSGNDARKWYTGSQTIRQSVTDWLTSSVCDIGVLTGVKYAYKDTQQKEAKFAYIAGDITKSYPSATVDYVGRRMLTVYTDNPDFPMALFVYDDITSDSENFKKTFLLQINSANAPTISGNTVTTENGGGRLVLTSLTDGVSIEGIGGKGKQQYINGMECRSDANKTDNHWGRVEISHPTDSKDDTFLNVLYVTDGGSTKTAPTIAKLNGKGMEGAVFGSIAVIFAADREGNIDAIETTVPGEGSMEYYISGLYAGTWNVAVNGENVGIFTAAEGEGMITFTAPAGTVLISPSADIMPAGHARLVLTLNGGEAAAALPTTYSQKDGLFLPAAKSVTYNGSIFRGWFNNPECTGTPIREILPGTTGTVRLYAGWQVMFANEDYNGETMHVQWEQGDTARARVGILEHRINANKNAVASVKTDASGNGYLSMMPGGGYPDICCTGYALSQLLPDGKVTFSVDMAKGANGAPASSTFRMRADSGGTANTLPIFRTKGDKILLGSTDNISVGTLTETLTNYSFVVDFFGQTLYAYDANGKKIAETTFTVPAASNLTTGKEWLATLSSWVFNWSISGTSGKLDEELLIDDVCAISGDLFG